MDMIVRAERIQKSYEDGDRSVVVLRGCSVTLERGEFVALSGPSGCGKSSLLNIIGLADPAFTGSLHIDGERIEGAREVTVQRLRRAKVGYVFQQFNLLSTLTVLENVMVPLILLGASSHDAKARSTRVLDRVGLSHRLAALPHTLSGGEAQRTAIARAVVHKPSLVIADEPTGNLDSLAGARVLDLLVEIAAEGIAVLMATHSDSALERASRVVRMKDGELVGA